MLLRTVHRLVMEAASMETFLPTLLIGLLVIIPHKRLIIHVG